MRIFYILTLILRSTGSHCFLYKFISYKHKKNFEVMTQCTKQRNTFFALLIQLHLNLTLLRCHQRLFNLGIGARVAICPVTLTDICPLQRVCGSTENTVGEQEITCHCLTFLGPNKLRRLCTHIQTALLTHPIRCTSLFAVPLQLVSGHNHMSHIIMIKCITPEYNRKLFTVMLLRLEFIYLVIILDILRKGLHK